MAISLRGLNPPLSGNLSCEVANATSLLSIDVSNNALTGTVPPCLAQNLLLLTSLNLAQNRLSGTLPPELPPNSNLLRLSVFDNQLSGTLPASFSSLSQLALAYNPALFGQLPPTVTATRLLAWSGTAFTTCGAASAPTSGIGCLFGTSIGLDRPMTAIMIDLASALDPPGRVLSSWSTSVTQFCPPYTGQNASSPGYGRWLAGLFKPSALGAPSGTTYCQDIGIAPTVPAPLLNGAYTALTNALLSASTPSSTLPVQTSLWGGMNALVLSNMSLSGTVPVQLRELRTTQFIMLTRNNLTGTLPSAWGSAVSWNNSAVSTAGFDACTLLDVGQNALSGTLPASLSSVGGALGVSVYDNLFIGSVPPSYASLSWLCLAYNPQLVGAPPAGVNGSKLFAWSAAQTGFYAWSYVYAATACPLCGMPPSQAGAGSGTGFLYGTSIGLDRPLASILLDIKSGVDPSGAALSSWNASQLQPCRPWSNAGVAPFQSALSPGYGRGWKYVSTSGVTGSAEYCQDWQSGAYYVYTSPTAYATNTQPVGGVAGLWLSNVSLSGTLPVQLQELRTATVVTLSMNSLTGSVPSAWCVCRSAARASGRAFATPVTDAATPRCAGARR